MVIDTQKSFQEKISTGYEQQLSVLRGRVAELERILQENQGIVTVCRLFSSPYRVEYDGEAEPGAAESERYACKRSVSGLDTEVFLRYTTDS